MGVFVNINFSRWSLDCLKFPCFVIVCPNFTQYFTASGLTSHFSKLKICIDWLCLSSLSQVNEINIHNTLVLIIIKHSPLVCQHNSQVMPNQ